MSHVLETSVDLITVLVTEVGTEAATAEIAVWTIAACVAVVAASVLVPRRSPEPITPAARRWWAVARLAAAVVALLLLGAQVSASGWLTGADAATYDWFLAHRDPAVTAVALVVTDLGGPVGVAVLAVAGSALLGWRRRSVTAPLGILGIVAVALTASTLTKLLVARDRPPIAGRLVPEDNYSFPSGHVTATTALAGALLLMYALGHPGRRRMTAATLAAVGAVVLVSLTRLYLGVHWLTDVVGGALLGTAVTCAAAIWLLWSSAAPATTDDQAHSPPDTAPFRAADPEHVTTPPVAVPQK